jgi:hypothetical protein
MCKHPVSIDLSNDTLKKIDTGALREKRSKSEWVEKHFEAVFSNA